MGGCSQTFRQIEVQGGGGVVWPGYPSASGRREAGSGDATTAPCARVLSLLLVVEHFGLAAVNRVLRDREQAECFSTQGGARVARVFAEVAGVSSPDADAL